VHVGQEQGDAELRPEPLDAGEALLGIADEEAAGGVLAGPQAV